MWRDNQLLLQLFEPQELEALVCGGTDLDFSALQRAAKYEDGFDAGSQVLCLSGSAAKMGDVHVHTCCHLCSACSDTRTSSGCATSGSMPYPWGWCGVQRSAIPLFRHCKLEQQRRSRLRKGLSMGRR